MKLCLDEQLSASIAVELRKRGHDVTAIQEIPQLRGKSDIVIFLEMASQQRAVATEDVGDFLAIASRAVKGPKRIHYGLIAVLQKRFPRRKGSEAALIDALDALLIEHPKDDALVNRVVWLEH